METFVNPIEYGIKADKIYYYRQDIREKLNISIDELENIGIRDGLILVSLRIIEPLLKAQAIIRKSNMDIVIKDGYRSPDLYKLAYDKRVIIEGLEKTNLLLNMDKMPHSSGLVVDLGLINLETNEPVSFYSFKDDGTDSWFVDFYRDKQDPQSVEFQRIQDIMINAMLASGFKLGQKKEIWHFELDC